MEHVVIYVTVPDEGTGSRLGRGLVESRLAACVNIVSGLRSIYWWRGEVEEARECLLVIKSRREKLSEIIRFIKMNHPYEVPEIIALPIVGGGEDYLRWIDESVGVGNA
jgi:periplasmic divalent cation tolerance protein